MVNDAVVNDRTQAADTAELVDLLFTVMPMVADHVNARLESLEMTTTDYWALRSVEGPMPMKDLATCMEVDPSYVTIVADRLENLGLIERQPHPADRRIKNLVLTPKGEKLKKALPGQLWTGSNTFSSLSDGERSQLIDIFTRLAASNDSDLSPPAASASA